METLEATSKQRELAQNREASLGVFLLSLQKNNDEIFFLHIYFLWLLMALRWEKNRGSRKSGYFLLIFVFRGRINDYVPIRRFSALIFMNLGTKSKESAQKLRIFDLWFFIFSFSYLTVQLRF